MHVAAFTKGLSSGKLHKTVQHQMCQPNQPNSDSITKTNLVANVTNWQLSASYVKSELIAIRAEFLADTGSPAFNTA